MNNAIYKIIYLFSKLFLLFSLLVVITLGIFLFIKISNLDTEASSKKEIEEHFNFLDSIYSYEIINKSSHPKLNIGETATLFLKIKNTGNTVWLSEGKHPVFLGTSHCQDRETVFYKKENKGWFSGNRVRMDRSMVYPGQQVYFIFEITAPMISGIYREYFTPLVEYKTWMEDKDIYWDIEVRDPSNPDQELSITVNGMPLKYINIKLNEQKLYAYEDGLVKYLFVTSTGRIGMSTPTGKFEIHNKFSTQYSEPYNLYMDNWMAITPDGRYGIHALPYWKLKGGGKLYEGEDHLGTKVSHGCIRLSVSDAKILYDWAEVGMPVFIED